MASNTFYGFGTILPKEGQVAGAGAYYTDPSAGGVVKPYEGMVFHNGTWWQPTAYQQDLLTTANLNTQLNNNNLVGANTAADLQAKTAYNDIAKLAGNKLTTLLSDPSSVSQTPAYKFAFDQGMEGINRTAAAKGMLGSGNRLYDLTNYGQGLASQTYNQTVGTLGNFLNKNPITQPTNSVKSTNNPSGITLGGSY